MKRRIAIATATGAFSVGLQISTYHNDAAAVTLFVVAAFIVLWTNLPWGWLFGRIPLSVSRKRGKRPRLRGVAESDGVAWRYIGKSQLGLKVAPFCRKHGADFVFKSDGHGDWIGPLAPNQYITTTGCQRGSADPHGWLWCGGDGGHGVTFAKDPTLYEHARLVARHLVAAKLAEES